MLREQGALGEALALHRRTLVIQEVTLGAEGEGSLGLLLHRGTPALATQFWEGAEQVCGLPLDYTITCTLTTL